MTARLRERLARQPPGYRFTIGRILAIYSALMVTLLLAALDQTIVATALPQVVGDLGGLTQYSWVFTAYMLATTVTVPLYGKLGDVYGRRPLFLTNILWFTAISKVGPSRASLFSNMQPAFGVVFALVLLGEHLTGWEVAGGALILSAVVLERSRRPAVEPPGD